MSITKKSSKRLKTALLLERYAPNHVRLQLNIKFHKILFISSRNIMQAKYANFHPYSYALAQTINFTKPKKIELTRPVGPGSSKIGLPDPMQDSTWNPWRLVTYIN